MDENQMREAIIEKTTEALIAEFRKDGLYAGVINRVSTKVVDAAAEAVTKDFMAKNEIELLKRVDIDAVIRLATLKILERIANKF